MRRGVWIEGAGIAGQVLHRELGRRGIPSKLVDRSAFPRDKVCGGLLQADSWAYLNQLFLIQSPRVLIPAISHFWQKTLLARALFPEPAVYVSRLDLDGELYGQRGDTGEGDAGWMRVNAAGISGHRFDASRKEPLWLGFHGKTEAVRDLEMHYGRGIYLGRCPDGTGESHAGFIVRKELFSSSAAMAAFGEKELGVRFLAPLKGAGPIRYGSSGAPLAVGDAKLTLHPFLGLGMKHAIESARLLADCIEKENTGEYDRLHRRRFARMKFASGFAAALYDSPARFLFLPVLKFPPLFIAGYRWVHRTGR